MKNIFSEMKYQVKKLRIAVIIRHSGSIEIHEQENIMLIL